MINSIPAIFIICQYQLKNPHSAERKIPHLAGGDGLQFQPASECDKVVLSVNRYGDNGNIADPVNFNRLPEPLAA
jgi:hypothetical protein